MNVQVVGDTGARRQTEIHSHIETRWFVNLAQSSLRTLRLVHQVVRDLFRRGVKLARMQIWHDHQVATDVRVEIQQHKTMLGAMKHKVLFVVFGIARDRAEYTTVFLRINT